MTKTWFCVFLKSVCIFISLHVNGMFSVVVIMKAWFHIFFNLNLKVKSFCDDQSVVSRCYDQSVVLGYDKSETRHSKLHIGFI